MFYERALILKVVFARGQDEKILIKVNDSYSVRPSTFLSAAHFLMVTSEFLRSHFSTAPPIPAQKRQEPSLAQDLFR